MPTRRPVRTAALRPLAGGTLALALVVPLAACSEDGPLNDVSWPAITLPSGDALRQFVRDAQDQLDTIGTDVGRVRDQLGNLSGSARESVETAVENAQEARATAQAAIDDARDARDGAAQRLSDARTELEAAKESATEAIESLQDATGEGTDEARARLEELRESLETLQSEVQGS